MDNIMSRIQRVWQKFRRDEQGNAPIELIFCTPIFVYALMSTMVYFDAYHNEAKSTRAGLTIADLFSREDGEITEAYMDNALKILRILTDTEDEPVLRVTVYQYFEDTDKYRVVWSRNRGFDDGVREDSDLAAMVDALPVLADQDTSILVETETDYYAPFSLTISPFFAQDLSDLKFQSFTVIRPRFVRAVCFKDVVCDLAAPSS